MTSLKRSQSAATLQGHIFQNKTPISGLESLWGLFCAQTEDVVTGLNIFYLKHGTGPQKNKVFVSGLFWLLA